MKRTIIFFISSILFILMATNEPSVGSENLTDKQIKSQHILDPIDFSQDTRTNQQTLLPLSVNARNIKNISWDKGQGGTLTLGGSNNGNGLLSVKDASNVEQVRLDNTGILINNGKMTIKDKTNTAIIDATGLVSTVNFISGSLNDNSQRDITSSTFVDIPNTTVTTSSLARTTNVLIIMNVVAEIYEDGADSIDTGRVVLNIDGSNQTSTIFDQVVRAVRSRTGSTFSFDSAEYSMTGMDIRSLAAGTHTLKIQASGILTSTNKFRVISTSVIYIVLGK